MNKHEFQVEHVIGKVLSLGYKPAPFLADWLRAAQNTTNIQSLFKHLFHSRDTEVFQDYLAELRFALMFKGLGYDVAYEPFGSEGADIRIYTKDDLYIVEVTRIRHAHSMSMISEEELSDENFILPDYGNIERDTRKSIRKILRKLRQANHDNSIIAIWNDDGELDEIEMEFAINYIRSERSASNIRFILYSSNCIGSQQNFCFPINKNFSSIRLSQIIETNLVDEMISNVLKSTYS